MRIGHSISLEGFVKSSMYIYTSLGDPVLNEILQLVVCPLIVL